VSDTIGAMRAFWPAPSRQASERVANFTEGDLASALVATGLSNEQIEEVVSHWAEAQASDEWSSLLAMGCTMVARDRGNVDRSLPIWEELDDQGDVGRLFYFFLAALCCDDTIAFLRENATPEHIIESTMNIYRLHAATHLCKHGTLGFDAGWWSLLVLRGELLAIGSLQFHRVNLGVGTLAPEWYNDDDPHTTLAGFRRGDASVGVHIPQGADLTPTTLERTFDEARRVLGRIWPTNTRRLATCRSWMLDERLLALRADSNLVSFLRRFELVPGTIDGDEEVVDFVFQMPGVALADLPRHTSLERLITSVLERGEHWHIRSGWFDFDGTAP
jgi:hypothetical protein